MKISRECLICGSPFERYPSKRRGHEVKYCSNNCRHIGNSVYQEFWAVASYSEKIERLSRFFNMKVVINSQGCWGWTGRLLSGRGVLMWNKTTIQAHRASWLIHKGEIPEGFIVCHSCDNPICSNPDHLYLGTCQENVRDAFKTGASKRKLTPDQAKEIKSLLSNGMTGSEIAKKYNVTTSTICDINRGRIWSWLT